MMTPADIYTQYDRLGAGRLNQGQARYALEWSTPDGIIFYPDGYLARSRAQLLALGEPELPVCIAVLEKNVNAVTEEGIPLLSLERATNTYPNALLAMCGDQNWAELTMPELAAHAPGLDLSRCVLYRELGDFLPYGGKKTHIYDVARKSDLPAQPRVRDKVMAAWNLYADSLSRATFLAILRRYLLSSNTPVPYLPPEEQYFSPVYRSLDTEVFIDCGGFDGDTLRQFVTLRGDTFARYVLFEPDPLNFEKLQQTLAAMPETITGKVDARMAAVGHENGTINFAGGGASNSYVDPDGSQTIACVTLDDAVADAAPTFIKMDLQGYEAFALTGGRKLIAESSPVLAISIYHFVRDFWELPLLIHKMNPGYRYFLRAYRPEEEYICYAVPPDRVSR